VLSPPACYPGSRSRCGPQRQQRGGAVARDDRPRGAGGHGDAARLARGATAPSGRYLCSRRSAITRKGGGRPRMLAVRLLLCRSSAQGEIQKNAFLDRFMKMTTGLTRAGGMCSRSSGPGHVAAAPGPIPAASRGRQSNGAGCGPGETPTPNGCPHRRRTVGSTAKPRSPRGSPRRGDDRSGKHPAQKPGDTREPGASLAKAGPPKPVP